MSYLQSTMMPNKLNETHLFALAAKIEASMGLYFPKSKHADLLRRLHGVTHDLGCSSTVECVARILAEPSNRQYQDILAKHLTIGETYFFRNKLGIQLLNTKILPDIIRRQDGERTLKIWSAACATGEEPYSMSMLLDGLLPPNKGWKRKIFASDINLDFLSKARAGIYGDWSFRNTPQITKNRYFQQRADKKYQIVDEIKQSVDFFQWNLITDTYPSVIKGLINLDLILCQNVFIYFEPETIFKVLKQFYETLNDGGWLIISPSEAPFVSASEFHYTANVPGGICFQKRKPTARVVSTPTPPKLKSPKPQPNIERAVAQSPNVEKQPPEESLHTEILQHYQHGHYQKVIEKLNTAMFSNGKFWYCGDKNFRLLIRAYANAKQFDAGLQCCKAVIEQKKLHPLPHYLMGTILQIQGKPEIAIAAFRRALYLNDGCELAYYGLANAYRQLSQNRQAKQNLQTLLVLLEKYPDEKKLRGDDELTVKMLKNMASALLEILEG